MQYKVFACYEFFNKELISNQACKFFGDYRLIGFIIDGLERQVPEFVLFSFYANSYEQKSLNYYTL